MTRSHYRVLAILWTVGILVATSLPGTDLPDVDILTLDKPAHFLFFAGFGWLWLRALSHPLRIRIGWVLGTGVAFAILTEVYQGFLPFERTPDPVDALFNVSGLVVAVAIYYYRHRSSLPQ